MSFLDGISLDSIRELRETAERIVDEDSTSLSDATDNYTNLFAGFYPFNWEEDCDDWFLF